MKKKWEKSERNAVDVAPGGRVHRGSGSNWWCKGDTSNAEILVENKYTEAKQFILKKDYLERVKKQAWRSGKKMALRVDFDGTVYVVIPIEDLGVEDE